MTHLTTPKIAARRADEGTDPMTLTNIPKAPTSPTGPEALLELADHADRQAAAAEIDAGAYLEQSLQAGEYGHALRDRAYWLRSLATEQMAKRLAPEAQGPPAQEGARAQVPPSAAPVAAHLPGEPLTMPGPESTGQQPGAQIGASVMPDVNQAATRAQGWGQ